MAVLRTVTNVPFFFCEVWNNNHRFYPREVATKKILSPKIMKYMENKQLYGEINHPAERVGTDFDYVSHIITNMYYDEDKNAIIGSYDVLDTPRGRVLNTLLEYGCNVGISARALGKGKRTSEGEIVDVDSYVFKTFDVVANPGFEGATVLSESEDSLKQELKSLYESLDEDGQESLNLLFETFYETTINSNSSQDSSEEESLHSYEERMIDLEFELNYYKDLYEETKDAQNTELLRTNRRLVLDNNNYQERLLEQESVMEVQRQLIEKQQKSVAKLLESYTNLKEEKEILSQIFEAYKHKAERDLKSMSESHEESDAKNLNESNTLKSMLEHKQEIITEQISEINLLKEKVTLLESDLSLSNEKYASTLEELNKLQEDVNESLKPQEVQFNLLGVKVQKTKAHSETKKLCESLNKIQ